MGEAGQSSMAEQDTERASLERELLDELARLRAVVAALETPPDGRPHDATQRRLPWPP